MDANGILSQSGAEMEARTSLTDLRTHFKFGENWRGFSRLIDEEAMNKARRGLSRMLPENRIEGARFLDIGCGSGIHAVAALSLGAQEVVAIDIDPASVETTKEVLDRFGFSSRASVEAMSVFDARPENIGLFDIVYSWGVLHHTGAMWSAVDRAGKLVKPGGIFAISLYRKTSACGFWTMEKRFYAHAPALIQRIMRSMYKAAIITALALTGKNPFRYVRAYSKRGMDWSTDVHDWLGGYPYESTTSQETVRHVAAAGFRPVSIDKRPGGLGIFGSGCSEYVFEKISLHSNYPKLRRR